MFVGGKQQIESPIFRDHFSLAIVQTRTLVHTNHWTQLPRRVRNSIVEEADVYFIQELIQKMHDMGILI